MEISVLDFVLTHEIDKKKNLNDVETSLNKNLN